jgi:uncharacterized protein YndB with AHSA1/START domain
MTRDFHRPGSRRIDASITIDVPAARVWQAWTDPVDLSRWFTDDARGEVVEGGSITWIFRGFDVEIPYPVLAAEPGRRMVLGMTDGMVAGEEVERMPGDAVGAGEPGERGPFALEVELHETGGRTTVRLVNSGFLDGAAWDEEYEGIDSGWRMALALLKHYLERHRDRPKHTRLAFRPCVLPWDTLANELYRTEQGLARWLTEGGSIGETGDPVRLVLAGGLPLTGHVLVRTPTEVAISWDEEDATLELKAFRAGEKRMAGIRTTAWGTSEARIEALAAMMDEAVGRLDVVRRAVS